MARERHEIEQVRFVVDSFRGLAFLAFLGGIGVAAIYTGVHRVSDRERCPVRSASPAASSRIVCPRAGASRSTICSVTGRAVSSK
jgi:hypothetical protein